jgi:Putative transposase
MLAGPDCSGKCAIGPEQHGLGPENRKFASSVVGSGNNRGVARGCRPIFRGNTGHFPAQSRPAQVLDYVGRYTHRVAISNNRLLSMDDGKVCFRWKDYRDDNRQRTMTLPAEEFIRRFLIHVLPDGFHRIRYFGFLGNCHRAQKLQRCRELLGMAPAGPAVDPPVDYRDRFEALTGQSLRVCPHCRTGTMVVIDCIARPKICQPIPDTS